MKLFRKLFTEEENEYFNVVALVTDEQTGLTRVHRAHNIVTTAGNVYTAQKAAGEATTNAFANLYLYSASITPGGSSTYSATNVIASTEKAPASGYPKSNDSDTDNTGKGTTAVTRKYFYAAADFNAATIIGALIAKAAAAGGDPTYAAWDFTSFGKTASDTLTVYHNSTMLWYNDGCQQDHDHRLQPRPQRIPGRLLAECAGPTADILCQSHRCLPSEDHLRHGPDRHAKRQVRVDLGGRQLKLQ